MPDFTVEFTGLSLIYRKGQAATAYFLGLGQHCCRLYFPYPCLKDHEWPGPVPDLIHVPGRPPYVCLDFGGHTARFEGLDRVVEGEPVNEPLRPDDPGLDWSDLSCALDLRYLSGVEDLDSESLGKAASAALVLPAGRLEACEPGHTEMKAQCWEVSSPKGMRQQALTDRMLLRVPCDEDRVTVRFSNRLGETGSLLLQTDGLEIAASALCGFEEDKIGAPDVAEYERFLPGGVRLELLKSCATGPLSANASGCPPTRFFAP